MARRSKQPTTSPNKVLVIFLVFFILLTMVFGGWVYMQARDKDNWDAAAKTKDNQLQEARREAEFAGYRANEMEAAIGREEFLKDPEALKTWKENREKYKDYDPDFKKFIKEVLEKQLDGFDDGYKNRYSNLREPLEAKLKEADTKYSAEVKKNNDALQESKAQQKKNAADYKKLADDIAAGNAKAMEARLKKSEEMTLAIEQNEKWRKQIAEDAAKIEELNGQNTTLTPA